MLLILTLLYAYSGIAQTGIVLWFAPPDLANHGEASTRLVSHAYDQPATITVEQPANPFFPTVSVMLHPPMISTL
ncbi:MAG: hypothetical protein IJ785_06475 [Bacteroidales bacterium]|nr:hypothetical protein [Bacteroidales bacterium]